MTQTHKIAFIKARWHADIVDQALVGFNQQMQADGFACEVSAYDVPGAFEAPLLAKRLAVSHDAVVIAALVVDGGIYRHDFVAAAVVNGIMQAQLETDVPMFSVSLTPHHFHAHDEHQRYFKAHFLQKGAEAAEAVQMVLKLEI
ncbi:MAG: 6,7-dimethyl-8-ribityllumazine synthase [Rhodobacteraceae bacterium]|nr:6,7-dimethyl-8-ribityllumazine synthase [Paracoccaceae bacterium]